MRSTLINALRIFCDAGSPKKKNILFLFLSFSCSCSLQPSGYSWLPLLQVCLHHCFYKAERPFFRTLQNLPVSCTGERRNCAVVVKATSDSSDSSTSLSIVKSVQNVWDKSDEDRVGLIGLGFAAIVALWASTNLISAIDKLPLIPNVLEFIGILFSSWFIYRYLLFKPDREELLQIIKKSISEIFGQ